MNIVYKEKVGLIETSISMEEVNLKDFSSHAKMTNTIRSMIEAIKDIPEIKDTKDNKIVD
jgi:hypothetical protein